MYYTEKKKILLSEEDERAFLETFTAEGDGALRPAMLVIPGGAYRRSASAGRVIRLPRLTVTPVFRVLCCITASESRATPIPSR